MLRTVKRPRLGRGFFVVIALTLGIVSTACNPYEGLTDAQVTTYNAMSGSNLTRDVAQDACLAIDEQHGAGSCAKLAAAATTQVANQPAIYQGPRPLSAAQLARLAKCEAGGNPAAVSKSGSFRGLYQFNKSTWNGVAKRILPKYVGVSPDKAPREVQDAMAQKLFSERGRAPWPVCGKKI